VAALVNNYEQKNVFSEICDCTDIKSLQLLAENILSKWDGIDIVVANVGDGRSVSDALPSEEKWEEAWGNNFDSAIQTARVFLPLLQESGGCLLFISSIAGLEAFGAPVDYSTAKSAVIALAKNMARKLGPTIRVNVVCPGNVLFPGGNWDVKKREDPESVSRLIETNVPMNRFGLPEEIADTAVFLCSARASFITGSVFVVDGGQTMGVL
jgi:3-oxoacyl-[acyl-carrier protein] reductase